MNNLDMLLSQSNHFTIYIIDQDATAKYNFFLHNFCKAFKNFKITFNCRIFLVSSVNPGQQ